MNNNLELLREKINEIDKEMKTLFVERMNIVKDVALFKREYNLNVFDNKREKEVIERNSLELLDTPYYDYYVKFLEDLMNVSKEYQRKILLESKVGYQGTKGAFSHLTSKKLFPVSELINYSTFEDLVSALEREEVRYAVLPFENSYTGEVKEVLDLLYKYNVYINGIYDLEVNQNLIGLKGSKLENIHDVYSHEQAYEQSMEYFKDKNILFHSYHNTALAAAYIKEKNDYTKACIASRETAKYFDLEILQENINTSKKNQTRFIILEKKLHFQGNRFSLVFTVKNGKGQLAPIMNIIAKHGFDLECIRSHSLKNEPWQYFFYVEVVGNIQSEEASRLLEELDTLCQHLKILGSYNIKR